MEPEPKIKRMLVDEIGWIEATKEQPIERFTVNGEMTLITWYRHENKEYNGKYVIAIVTGEKI